MLPVGGEEANLMFRLEPRFISIAPQGPCQCRILFGAVGAVASDLGSDFWGRAFLVAMASHGTSRNLTVYS